MSIFNKISTWFGDLARAFRTEISVIVHDMGVLVFFLGLPLAYPIVYTLIYNTEDVRELPVAVVDNCRSAESRRLVRMVDATQQIKLYDYATDMGEAKRWMAAHDVYGILEIPSGYSDDINSGRQATAVFYSDMSLLLRYRAFVSALTDVQLAAGTDITQQRLDMVGLPVQAFQDGLPINTQTNFMGDTQQGFASFIMPGIVVLILQQSMVLGISLISGTAAEGRRRRRGSALPLLRENLSQSLMPSASVLGRALSYMVFYIPLTIYILHYVPVWFNLPHQGSPVDYLLLMLPYLLASACFGIMLGYLMRRREDAFLYIVFTSVVFLFLSGLTWPRYAMNEFWYAVSGIVPATWGVDAFVRINSNAATLAEQSHAVLWLWGLAVAYFVASWAIERFVVRRQNMTF